MKLADRDIFLTLLRGGKVKRKYWKGILTTGSYETQVVYNGDVPYSLVVEDLSEDDWEVVE